MDNGNNTRVTIYDAIALLQELEYKNNKLAEENKYLRTQCVNINKYYARTFSVEMVAYLHDVHPHTVRKYVSCGLIPKHPDSKDGKILIRATDALSLDFDELRRKHKVQVYNSL